MPVSPEEFRRAMRSMATGVTVVTTVVDDVVHAMTANSFTSVSLDPLLALVCVERSTRFHGAVLESGVWAVSVLPASRRDASVWFATDGRPLADQLAHFAHHPGPVTGAPVLDDALATVECRTAAVHDGGDHSIVVGEVVTAITADASDAQPLLYFGGTYHRLGAAEPQG